MFQMTRGTSYANDTSDTRRERRRRERRRERRKMVDQPKIYKKRVKLQITQIEMEAYRPTKRGLAARWYNFDPERLTAVLELVAFDAMPNPLESCTMEDIDKELERIAPRIIEDNPNVRNLVTGQDMRIELNLSAPAYRDGRWDSLIDKAKDVHTIKLRPDEVWTINSFYDKRSALFKGKSKLEDVKENEDKSVDCEFGTVFEG